MPRQPSDAARAVLAAAPIAWLTVNRRGGSPHVTPVWFVFDVDRFWIATARRNRKVALLAADDHVSLAIDGSGARPLVAEGRALLHPPDARQETIRRALQQKYDGWDPFDDSDDGERLIVEVPVVRWLLTP